MLEVPLVLAYLDPATGSLVIQALIAGLVSLGYVFRRVLWSPLGLFLGQRPLGGSKSTDERSS